LLEFWRGAAVTSKFCVAEDEEEEEEEGEDNKDDEGGPLLDKRASIERINEGSRGSEGIESRASDPIRSSSSLSFSIVVLRCEPGGDCPVIIVKVVVVTEEEEEDVPTVDDARSLALALAASMIECAN
jgi:hypothetical protein